MTTRTSLPMRSASAPEPAACPLPPPDMGRLYNPPHPLYGIVFLWVIGETLLWGARTTGGGSQGSLSAVYLALCICLIGTVHFLEGVQLRHVASKLGLRRPRARALVVAGLAAAPAVAIGAWSALGTDSELPPVSRAAVQGVRPAGIVLVAVAALWLEGFYRGYAFRGCMRRHGFLLSAVLAAALQLGAEVFRDLSPSSGFQPRMLLPWSAGVALSLALAQLFWLGGESLWPCLLVRAAVLFAGARADAGWPLGAAALVVWSLLRFVPPRPEASHLSASEGATRR